MNDKNVILQALSNAPMIWNKMVDDGLPVNALPFMAALGMVTQSIKHDWEGTTDYYAITPKGELYRDSDVLATADILKIVSEATFNNGGRVFGWQSVSHGLWKGDDTGKKGVALIDWLEINFSHVAFGDLAKALGMTREGVYYNTQKHGLEPVIKGKYRPDDVAEFLKKMGRYATCPNCWGMAAVNQSGEIVCLLRDGESCQTK